MQPADRAARLGLTIAVSGVLVIVLACAGVFLLIKFVPATLETSNLSLVATNPGADIVVRRNFQRRFMASAVLDLPPTPPQADSPSLQVSFFQPGAIVQGGVIRTPADKFRLEGFLAFTRAGSGRTQVRYFRNLPEGPHTVLLTGDERDIAFSIDGRVLDRLSRDTFLPTIGPNDPWLMIGTAVGAPGSGAFGSFSKIFVRDENDEAPTSIMPSCVVTKGGITLQRFDAVWRLGGRYDPRASATFRGCTPKGLRA
jgi:hypothetical protein